jgi:nicotinate-nucleotide pyrophosphorylase (carboxylating)
MYCYYIPQALSPAARTVKEKFPAVLVEASGGVTEDTLTQFCDPNVDVISLSRLTQGYDTVDYSMKIRKDGIDPRNLMVKL